MPSLGEVGYFWSITAQPQREAQEVVRDAGVDNLHRGPGLCDQEVFAPQPQRLPQGLEPAAGGRGEAGPQPHIGGQHRQAHLRPSQFSKCFQVAAHMAFHEMWVGGVIEAEDTEEETSRWDGIQTGGPGRVLGRRWPWRGLRSQVLLTALCHISPLLYLSLGWGSRWSPWNVFEFSFSNRPREVVTQFRFQSSLVSSVQLLGRCIAITTVCQS